MESHQCCTTSGDITKVGEKYEAQWSFNLIQLKNLAELKPNRNKQTNRTIMEQQISTLNILLEIPIKAEINHVWNCLLSNDISLWWRKGFYTSPKIKEFILFREN